MTALDNTNAANNSNSKNSGGSVTSSHRGSAGGRLSLRGQKRTLSSDISPAPEPRTSHRIRTNSSGENVPDTSKSSSSGRNKNATPAPSSTPAYRAAQLGLRRQPAALSNTSAVTPAATSGGDGGVVGAGVAGGRVPGVCPLANLGNTCFLNSVLYALRFLPGFTHDLHHLHTHLQAARYDGDESLQQRVQFLSELHAVFVQLGREERSVTEARRLPALQPYPFLQALRVVNPMFEGNRQQDAHELLHCLLDQLCHLPQDLVRRGAAGGGASHTAGPPPPPSPSSPPRDASLSPLHKRARRRSERIQAQEEDHSKAVDVVGSKFVGRMCLETCCSECEKVTGREETFLEVCVPVKTKADFDDEEPPSECEVFMSALCEEECLQGNNKYWCDACSHHNEARRSVHYPQLPHHLLIHVKRFSAYSRNMYTSKCSDAMPAPLQLSCFCRSCLEVQLLQQQQHLDGNCNRNTAYLNRALHHNTVNNNNTNSNSASGGINSRNSRAGSSSTRNNRNNNNNNSSSGSNTCSTGNEDGSSKVNGGNAECSGDATPHLPYYLSAMVCHLGASLSSGHYMTYVRVSARLSSSCPEQPLLSISQHSTTPDPCNTSTVTAPIHASSTATPGTSSAATNSSGPASVIANGLECNWLECCALRLDQALPQLTLTTITNGCVGDTDMKPNSKSNNKLSNSESRGNTGRNSSKNSDNGHGSTNKHSPNNSNSKQHNNNNSSSTAAAGLWLECDDEKIKLVSASEVVERMRGTLITPYLLFYSRLGYQDTNIAAS